MSVKKEPSGRRTIQVEVEVPGTPEEVWQAIATGPGISSWFVPTKIEEGQAGGRRIISSFGPGMDSEATETACEPPRRFAYECPLGPDVRALGTEWIVESRGGRLCVVRVVNSLFADSDDWDDQLEDFEGGWAVWFRTLRLYLTYFRGQTCTAFRLMATAPEPTASAWETLLHLLGLDGTEPGRRWHTPAGVPVLGGVNEGLGQAPHFHASARLDEPAPGIVVPMAHAAGGQVALVIHFYFYGERAREIASREEPRWRKWLQELGSITAC
jgi:uncharacterized protein YndB with AHSA1/START domain